MKYMQSNDLTSFISITDLQKDIIQIRRLLHLGNLGPWLLPTTGLE